MLNDRQVMQTSGCDQTACTLLTATHNAEFLLTNLRDTNGRLRRSCKDGHARLNGYVVRPKDVQDNATPSGSAMATQVLFKLAVFTRDARYVDAGEAPVAPLQPALAQAPTGFAWWLCGLEFELAPPQELAVVSPYPQPLSQGARGEGAEELLDVVFGAYRPSQVVAWKHDGEASPIPLLEGREAREGKATAYVCEHFACLMPVAQTEALTTQLEN